MRGGGWAIGLCAMVAAGLAARPALADDAIPPSDHIEAVQSRAWPLRNAFMLEPEGSIAFNDPFLLRGGGGLRAVYWIRSLIGVSLEATGWGQSPTEQAIIAQRELHAQMRPAASIWSVLGGAEIAPIDGKFALGSAIVPFEMFLRLGLGAAASSESVSSTPTFAFSAAAGVRWFMTSNVGLDLALTWQSASVTRSINGVVSASNDTIVGFDFGVPFRIGGER